MMLPLWNPLFGRPQNLLVEPMVEGEFPLGRYGWWGEDPRPFIPLTVTRLQNQGRSLSAWEGEMETLVVPWPHPDEAAILCQRLRALPPDMSVVLYEAKVPVLPNFVVEGVDGDDGSPEAGLRIGRSGLRHQGHGQAEPLVRITARHAIRVLSGREWAAWGWVNQPLNHRRFRHHLLHHQRSLSQAVEALNPQGALPASKRVLAFAPHFDDESLLFGSALASAVEGGADVRLVWLTNGGAHARIRREEAAQAAKTLGVSDHHLLDAPETRLHAGGAWVQKLRRLMVDFHPTRVLLPWWLDNHIDHFETTRVLAAAAQGQALDFEIAATGFWTPLPGGHAVAHHPLKEQALACHSSQLDEVDYLACAKGLSRWGGGDPNERYWCLPAREYLRRFAASGAARRRYRN